MQINRVTFALPRVMCTIIPMTFLFIPRATRLYRKWHFYLRASCFSYLNAFFTLSSSASSDAQVHNFFCLQAWCLVPGLVGQEFANAEYFWLSRKLNILCHQGQSWPLSTNPAESDSEAMLKNHLSTSTSFSSNVDGIKKGQCSERKLWLWLCTVSQVAFLRVDGN